MPAVNPDIIMWARKTAGLSLGDAAHALGLASEDRLQALESGKEIPSRPVLLKMANKYRRSLLTFYLSVPPRQGDRGQDFRTLSQDRSMTADALVDALIRDINTRQELVRTTLEDEEEVQSLNFIGSLNVDAGVMKVVDAIQARIQTSIIEYRSQKSAEEAFALLRDRVESIGVFVLLIGNLGTHHTAIPVEVFRGFAIADRIAPFVVINDQDAKTAWSFTLLHELAHLWIGASGVSGGLAELAVEKFCNDVAGEFLLPKEELQKLEIDPLASLDDTISVISQFATARHVSRSMVAYKLYRTGSVDWSTWRTLDGRLQEIWQQEKARHKARDSTSKSGPSYYVVRRHRLGRALLDFANRSINSGNLSPVKAAKVLGVKPRSVFPLLAEITRSTRSIVSDRGVS